MGGPAIYLGSIAILRQQRFNLGIVEINLQVFGFQVGQRFTTDGDKFIGRGMAYFVKQQVGQQPGKRFALGSGWMTRRKDKLLGEGGVSMLSHVQTVFRV